MSTETKDKKEKDEDGETMRKRLPKSKTDKTKFLSGKINSSRSPLCG